MNSLSEQIAAHLNPLIGFTDTPGTGTAVTIFLGAVLLLTLHRHNVLSYGTERDTFLPELFLASALFLIPVPGDRIPSLSIIFALLLIHASATVLLSYAVKRSPFVAFDFGFWIGILTAHHPAFFLFVPFLLYKFSQLKLLTAKHLSGFVMAIMAARWTALVLFAAPTPGGLWAYICRRWIPIMHPLFPLEGSSLFFFAGLLVLLIAFSAKVYLIAPRSIARHKWVMNFQIGISWTAFLACLVFSQLSSLLIASLFFLSSMLRHILSESNDRDNRPGWLFLSGIALGMGLMAYSHFGNPPSIYL